MAQNTLIVSNWKMNLNLINAKKLISKLKSLKISKNIKNIVCPQYLLIPHVRDLIQSSQIILGAQDCHFEEKGSFTGDSSVLLIKEYGCIPPPQTPSPSPSPPAYTAQKPSPNWPVWDSRPRSPALS